MRLWDESKHPRDNYGKFRKVGLMEGMGENDIDESEENIRERQDSFGERKEMKGGLPDGAGSEGKRKPFINIYLFGKPKDEKFLHINDVTKILNEARKKSLEEAQKVFAEMVKNGQINLSVHYGQQDKHIEGTHNYKQEIKKGRLPSILTADAKELVNKYAGNGELVFNEQGQWTQKEEFSDSKFIGINRNKRFSRTENTKNGTIHYLNKGVHIVPDKKERKKK